jgi:S1-C subfamily serine protease
VLQIGDKKIAMPEDVLNASFFLTAGDDVPITILRGSDKITVKVQAASELQPPLQPLINAGDPGKGNRPFEMQP